MKLHWHLTSKVISLWFDKCKHVRRFWSSKVTSKFEMFFNNVSKIYCRLTQKVASSCHKLCHSSKINFIAFFYCNWHSKLESLQESKVFVRNSREFLKKVNLKSHVHLHNSNVFRHSDARNKLTSKPAYQSINFNANLFKIRFFFCPVPLLVSVDLAQAHYVCAIDNRKWKNRKTWQAQRRQAEFESTKHLLS